MNITNDFHLKNELWSFIDQENNDFVVKTRYVTPSKIFIQTYKIHNINLLSNLKVGQVVIGCIINNCFQIDKFKNF